MPNPWIQFKELIASKPQWVGRIESINATTGKVTVSIPGTTIVDIVVTGGETYSVGDYVYIKDQVITSKAPDLKLIVNEQVS